MVRYEVVDKDKVTVDWNNLTMRDMEDIVKRVENILEVMERQYNMGYQRLLEKLHKDPHNPTVVENFKEDFSKTLNESGVDWVLMLMEDLQKKYISRSRARRHLEVYTPEESA
jgi:ADP-dependent phosphofructokinase/glucokinase